MEHYALPHQPHSQHHLEEAQECVPQVGLRPRFSLPVTLAALVKMLSCCGRTPAHSSKAIFQCGIFTRCTFENTTLRSARGSAMRRLHVSLLAPSGHISIDAPNRRGMFQEV